MHNHKMEYGMIKIITSLSYALMIVTNISANLIPINGVRTSEISDSYENLFTPAGFTFSIWGLIYFLLALHIFYEYGLFKRIYDKVNIRLVKKLAIPFTISSVANAAWIISWHYNFIALSMIFMVIILVSLLYINKEISKRNLNKKQIFFIRIPFSIYLGWITVATIANFTVLLVSEGWGGFGIRDDIWTVFVILIGTVIGLLTLLKYKNIEYGFTLIWAYYGIYARHASSQGLSGRYPLIENMVIICILLIVSSIIYVRVKFNKN